MFKRITVPFSATFLPFTYAISDEKLALIDIILTPFTSLAFMKGIDANAIVHLCPLLLRKESREGVSELHEINGFEGQGLEWENSLLTPLFSFIRIDDKDLSFD